MRDGRLGTAVEWVLLRRYRLLYTAATVYVLVIYGLHLDDDVSPEVFAYSALVAHGVFWLLERWLSADAQPAD